MRCFELPIAVLHGGPAACGSDLKFEISDPKKEQPRIFADL